MPKFRSRYSSKKKQDINLSAMIDIAGILRAIKSRRVGKRIRKDIFSLIQDLSADPSRHFYIPRNTEIEDDFQMEDSSEDKSVYYNDIKESKESQKWSNLLKGPRREALVCVLFEADEIDQEQSGRLITLELIISSCSSFMSDTAFFNYETPSDVDTCMLVMRISITLGEDGAKNIEILDRGLNEDICGHYNMKAVSLKIFSYLRSIINNQTTVTNDAQHIATAKWMATSPRDMLDIIRSNRADRDGNIESTSFENINAISLLRYQTDYYHQKIQSQRCNTIMYMHYSEWHNSNKYQNIWTEPLRHC